MDRVCALYIGWREGVRGVRTLSSLFVLNSHTILMLNPQFSHNTNAQFSILSAVFVNKGVYGRRQYMDYGEALVWVNHSISRGKIYSTTYIFSESYDHFDFGGGGLNFCPRTIWHQDNLAPQTIWHRTNLNFLS